MAEGYEWVDDPNKVTITFEVPVSVSKKKIVVNTRENGEIFLGYDAPPMFVVLDANLYDAVKSRKTTWKMKSSKVVVKLQKKKAEPWPSLTRENQQVRFLSFPFLPSFIHTLNFFFFFFLICFLTLFSFLYF